MTDAHQGVAALKTLHRVVRVRSHDRRPPSVVSRRYLDASQRVVSFGFSEPVHGIATGTVTVTDSRGAVVPGTWSCTRLDGSRTSCTTGAVRLATFTAGASPGPFLDTVDWEPVLRLDVLDAHGHPFVGTSSSPEVVD